MPGLGDRITGRLKKAAGDLVDDPNLREQGAQEERKADAKEELAQAQQKADRAAEEVARLERETAGRSGSAGTTGSGATASGATDSGTAGAAGPGAGEADGAAGSTSRDSGA